LFNDAITIEICIVSGGRVIYGYGGVGGMRLCEGNRDRRSIRPVCQQIPHNRTWNRTRVAKVGTRESLTRGSLRNRVAQLYTQALGSLSCLVTAAGPCYMASARTAQKTSSHNSIVALTRTRCHVTFTESFPSKGGPCCFHSSGFQPSCRNIVAR
jgi:hypothetical protein